MAARVLIVEDNPINRELLEYLLQAGGFQIYAAMDGRIGLDIALREHPDLILCDIQMPGMDGFEFAQRAKTDTSLRPIPLVALTALAMVGDRDRILSAGFDAYISKPIDAQSFMLRVNELLTPSLRGTDPTAPGRHTPAAPLEAIRVLVLDDTAANLELKRDLLRPHGFEVCTAETADDAWALARRQRPDLIISDVGLASGSGFDFIRRIKGDPALCHVPFIFLSSTHWDDASRSLGLQLGAVRYLRRPIEPALLLAEIRACLST